MMGKRLREEQGDASRARASAVREVDTVQGLCWSCMVCYCARVFPYWTFAFWCGVAWTVVGRGCCVLGGCWVGTLIGSDLYLYTVYTYAEIHYAHLQSYSSESCEYGNVGSYRRYPSILYLLELVRRSSYPSTARLVPQ